jgi:cysteinyl-tRNA synthetase
MNLHLYNTAARQKQAFTPIDPSNVRMYVCGPTVYDFAHIGNARPVVIFDVLFRLLRHVYGEGHVTYVRNITDVDDKINARAKAENISIGELTRKTTAEYHDDMAAMGSLPPTHEPRATDHIGGMVAMIEKLVATEHAYAADGHVLFHVPAYVRYGKLSGRSRDEMVAGARVEVAPYKRDPGDFVLWKPSDAQMPGWDSPWGRGRPGWHIECSAMSKFHLGEVFDIHGGGRDLIFPHHENEVAQSCCANGTDVMARTWVHNGFLTVDGEKMSKSIGNFLTVRGLRERYPGEALRLAMLKTHYRQPLDWTDAAVREAKDNLDRWYRVLRRADDLAARHGVFEHEREPALSDEVLAALADDLNTPTAFLRLSLLADDAMAAGDDTAFLLRAGELRASARLLGLLQGDAEAWFKWAPPGAVVDDAVVAERIAARASAKKARDFATADRIRADLLAQGVVLEDKVGGVTEWRRGN